MKTKPNIFQDAANHWPEDEANGIADYYLTLNSNYPEDSAENEAKLKHDCLRMERFFSAESDSADLIRRFQAEILRITKVNVTH